jgi:hypothetical protein
LLIVSNALKVALKNLKWGNKENILTAKFTHTNKKAQHLLFKSGNDLISKQVLAK